MSRQNALADAVLAASPLLTRFLTGFEDKHTAQAPNMPNHASWILGHCAYYMHWCAERLQGHESFQNTPEGFVQGGEGSTSAFAIELISFGSAPEDNPEHYPALDLATKVFTDAVEHLAATVRSATDAQLDRKVQWGQTEITMADAIARMIFHNGTHAGQLTDLRRALGMGGAI